MKDISLNKIFDKLINFYFPKALEDIKLWFRRKYDQAIHSNYVQLGAMLLGIALLCFLFTYITNMFTIPLGGDFVLQEIPFIFNGWDDWHYFFRTGEFPLWDTSGFLGVNNIGANSFYYLTSPWFFIYLLFPRSVLPQVQGILTMAKLMTGGLLFYRYLDCFKIEERTRRMGAIAFAFCGWMFYNLWFHFIDVAVLLPLMLLGIERLFQKKGPMTLILGLLLIGLTNYFFLASFTIASIFYVLFRFFQTLKGRNGKETLKLFGNGVTGYALGLLLTLAVLLPSITTVLSMPRVSGANYLDQLLGAKGILNKLKLVFVFEKPYEAIYPLTSFLFMNLSCFSTNIFANRYYNNTMSSIFVFTPFMLMLVPSILHSFRTKKWSYLVGTAATCFMLFTPFCYYLFHAFTLCYGRWEIMAVCWMLVFFCKCYDQRKKMPKWYMDISVLVIGGLMIFAGIYSLKIQEQNLGTFNPMDERMIVIPLQAAYVAVCYLVMRRMFHSDNLSNVLTSMLAFEAIIMGNVTIQFQGIQTYQDLAGGITNVNNERRIISKLQEYDDSFYRVFNSSADRGANNQAMRLGYNGLGTFHSVYPFEAQDLINWSRINYNNSWSMGVHEKRYNLDTLLGVKYYLLKNSDRNVPYGTVDVSLLDSTNDKELQSLQKALMNSGHKLMMNTNYIDTFFVYDTVIDSSSMLPAYSNTITEDKNEVNYLKYAIIDSEEYKTMVETNSYPEFVDKYDSSIKKTSTLVLKARDTIVTPPVNRTIYRANWKDGVYLNDIDPDSGEKIHTDFLEENPYFINPGDDKMNYSDLSNSYVGREILYYSKLVFDPYNPSVPFCPNASDHNGCYISVNLKLGYNIRFYLFTADGDIYSDDFHTWNGYDKTYDWKYARGFYTEKPIQKIVGIIYENLSNGADLGVSSRTPFVNYIYNDIYQADVDKLKAYRENIEILDYTANTLRFTTNFTDDNNHFTIINIPIDEGWKMTRSHLQKKDPLCEGENCQTEKIEEEVKLIKAQGGLIGFDAPRSENSEDIYTYTLSYYPKGLKLGIIGTLAGLIGSSSLSLFYMSQRQNRKLAVSKYFKLDTNTFSKENWEKKHKIRRKFK